jgi:transposase
MHYIGIDISKLKINVSLLLAPGHSKRRDKVLKNDPSGFQELVEWAARQAKNGPVHFVMEATGIYHLDIAMFLAGRGERVSVVNPAWIKKFGEGMAARAKTDAKDSVVIARYGAAMNPDPFVPPLPEYKELRALVGRLDQIDKMIRQEENHLEARPSPMAAASIGGILKALKEERADLLAQIRDFTRRHPQVADDVELLATIPGAGELTALRMAGILEGGGRFDKARQFGAYLGLTPREFQSGTSVNKKPRMTKMGSPGARGALYMPALTATRSSSCPAP